MSTAEAAERLAEIVEAQSELIKKWSAHWNSLKN